MPSPSAALFELSLVVPLYNEEVVFPELVRRVQKVVDQMALPAEVVLVDDGSSDRTRFLIAEACATSPLFRGVLLSRNFGHQTAVTAGLHHARSRYVVVMDGDLQDPPEIVPELYAKAREGFDVVYAVRKKRKENAVKRLAYWGFYRLLRMLANVSIPLDAGDFCIMSQRVVRCINAMPERNRFVRGIRTWVGFRQTGYEYERAERAAGGSKYTLRRLFQLAGEGLFNFSEVPLRLATLLGFLVAGVSLCFACFWVIWRLVTSESLPGFATLATAIFFLGGVHLICLGIIGEYIGRIYNEVKGRPSFIVDQTIGFEETNGQLAEGEMPASKRVPLEFPQESELT
jgi:glycosyltransferase involved in cell wall biosynthesis